MPLLLRSVPPLWSAISTGSGLVAGKLIACFRPEEPQCQAWRSIAQPRLSVDLSVLDDDLRPVHEVLPIEPEVHRAALEICDPQ